MEIIYLLRVLQNYNIRYTFFQISEIISYQNNNNKNLKNYKKKRKCRLSLYLCMREVERQKIIGSFNLCLRTTNILLHTKNNEPKIMFQMLMLFVLY